MMKLLDFQRFVLAAAFVLAFAPVFGRAQAPQTGPAASPAGNSTPKPISLEDYPRFKRIAGASISSDGKWMFYTVTPNEGDGTLFIKAFDSSTSYEIPRGTNPAFSDNARWVAYFVTPPTGRGGRAGGGAGAGAARRRGPGRRQARRRPARVRGARPRMDRRRRSSGREFSFSPDGEWLLRP
jgi:hypothetical protein